MDTYSKKGCSLLVAALPWTPWPGHNSRCSRQQWILCLQVGNNAGGLPQWLVSIIILASCATFSVIIMVIGRVVRYYTSRQGAGTCCCYCTFFSRSTRCESIAMKGHLSFPCCRSEALPPCIPCGSSRCLLWPSCVNEGMGYQSMSEPSETVVLTFPMLQCS